MVRGFLGGIFWGGLASVVAIGVASQMAPLPAVIKPQTETGQTQTQVQDPASGQTVQGGSQADQAVDTASASDAPSGDDVDTAVLADTDSAPVPATADVQNGLQAPDEGGEDVTVSSTGDTPPVTGQITIPVAPEGDAPDVPQVQEELSIATVPAQPVAPEIEDDGLTTGNTDTGNTDPTNAEVGSTEDFVTFETPVTEEIVTGETPELVPETQEDEVSLLQPIGTLIEEDTGFISKRLPSITDDSTETTQVDPEDVPDLPTQDVAPITAFAADFINPDNKPLMSIVLIDDPQQAIGPDALASFPYPITYAIDTLSPNAAERMRLFRDRGLEVMAMLDLPQGAAASDVEVALAAHLAALPESVAVLEGLGDGLQSSREISDQVTGILLQTGHGLVLFPKGLNTAQKLASREGVPAASVFRDFDGKGQNAGAIRRFLDQAAFKSGQVGSVVMVGRLRAETVSALLLWGLQDRASTVALSPISAVLTQNADQ